MEVQIRRREEVSHLPTKVLNEARIFIGSHLENGHPMRGLSREDEKKYLPPIIGVQPDHPTWEQKCREYWAEMGFLVPSGGVVLDVTVDPETKEPRKLDDWIKYQWVKKHKLVAHSEKAMENDPRKKFWIFNPEEATRRKNKEIQGRKAADVEFIKAAKDPEKGRRIIRMLKGNINPDILSDQQVENELYDLKNDDPVNFYKIASDKKLDVKAELMELLAFDVLRRVGNQIIYIDQVIGETIDDAVAWYQNPKNSNVVTTLKAKLKELKSEVAV